MSTELANVQVHLKAKARVGSCLRAVEKKINVVDSSSSSTGAGVGFECGPKQPTLPLPPCTQPRPRPAPPCPPVPCPSISCPPPSPCVPPPCIPPPKSSSSKKSSSRSNASKCSSSSNSNTSASTCPSLPIPAPLPLSCPLQIRSPPVVPSSPPLPALKCCPVLVPRRWTHVFCSTCCHLRRLWPVGGGSILRSSSSSFGSISLDQKGDSHQHDRSSIHPHQPCPPPCRGSAILLPPPYISFYCICKGSRNNSISSSSGSSSSSGWLEDQRDFIFEDLCQKLSDCECEYEQCICLPRPDHCSCPCTCGCKCTCDHPWSWPSPVLLLPPPPHSSPQSHPHRPCPTCCRCCHCKPKHPPNNTRLQRFWFHAKDLGAYMGALEEYMDQLEEKLKIHLCERTKRQDCVDLQERRWRFELEMEVVKKASTCNDHHRYGSYRRSRSRSRTRSGSKIKALMFGEEVVPVKE